MIFLVILTLTRDIQTASSAGALCKRKPVPGNRGLKWGIDMFGVRSEKGYRFSGLGLKRGTKNHTFLSEIGSGF